MIKIIEMPQRSDIKMTYVINGDVLKITIGGVTEEFDFTNLPEGTADEIEADVLKISPVLSAIKTGDEITVTILRFYGADEKGVFEFGENQMEA